MKKAIFTLVIFFAVHIQLNAQACGGIAPCVPNTSLVLPGLSPLSECLDPLVIGSTDTVAIQFVNFNTVYFGGTYTVDSLQVLSIYNLPTGLCWATNKANNLFYNQENGCIEVIGTVGNGVAAGQYQLDITVQVWLHGFGSSGFTINASLEGLYYFLRVVEPGDTCPHYVDTTMATIAADSILLYTPGQCPGTGVSCAQVGGCHYLVTYQPASQSIATGGNANFTFTSGEAHPSYQWQANTGLGYKNISDTGQYHGTGTNSLRVDTVGSSNNGNAYRCIVSYKGCVDTTSSALLTVRSCTPNGSSITTSICAGDTFHIAQQTYTHSGNFTDTLTNVNGCDSVVALALTVNPLPVVTLSWDSMVMEGALAAYNLFDTVFCTHAQEEFLKGGSPYGGSYSGRGVSGDTLYYNGYEGKDTISYTFINSNNCRNTASDTLLIEICGGINDVSPKAAFTLYPNPTENYTLIDFSAAATGSIMHLTDVTGRELMQTKLINSPQQLSTTSLPAGIYLVSVYANGQQVTRLLVKE